MAAAPEIFALDALGPQGSYRARERTTISDVSGEPVAELSLVPELFVARAMGALHEAAVPRVEERLAAIASAGAAYLAGTVDGLTAAEYQHLVSRVSGVPISVVRSAAEHVARCAAQAYRSVQCARPASAVNDWRDPLTRTGRAVWTRRGRVLAVHAPGNHPAVHASWLEALALGYKVAVRPSQREPFTPYRLVAALRAAGMGDDQVVLLPTSREVAEEILRGADLAIVYGGEDVVHKFGGHPTVLPQGPGRSKVLLTADVDWREYLDVVVDSISHEGGTACVNATAVFVEGDPAPVARAIAERLSTLPSLPPEDESAVLPAQPLVRAQRIERLLAAAAAGTVPWLGGNGIVHDLGDGSAVLRPAVHQLDRPVAGQVRVELPFPSVWVAPWSADAGVGPLKDSLVVTAITHDERLLDDLLEEPTIGNLYIGHHSTCWSEPGVPHDGYLADFLMRTTAVIRD